MASAALDKSFTKACEDVKKLKTAPADKDKLEVYALYKQATVGDCNTPEPGVLEVKDNAKWKAWNGKKGMTKEAAKAKYVEIVEGLVKKIGLQ